LKILGFEIKRNKPAEIVKDETPAVDVEIKVPSSKKPAVIKQVVDPTLRYRQLRYQGRSQFLGSEYDLVEIGRIEDTDAYVRQAFDKKVALMFKEGWDLVGKNPKTINYIKSRLGQISKASKVPTQELFRAIGSNVIRRSNAFVVKVRKTQSSGGKVRPVVNALTQEKELLEPIAGYFVLPAETMECKLEENQIAVWRQRMADGRWYVEWDPRDIVHVYFDRKEGFIFGTPMLVPVVDDIRALRKIEENVELLVYQHLFPLFQYKVGTPEAPAGLTETGEREIDVVKHEIQMMPSEGGIVTPERHEIIAIGAEGRALRAESYLEHFKKRVFSGLGISAVDMGEGDTANRATSDNMSRNMVDSVKDLQQVIEYFVTEHIFDELLQESTFGEDALNENNRVYLRFKEIDIDAQIKIANHYADLFNKNVVNWDEARRNGPGLEPILLPTPEEVETGDDLSDKYPEWMRTFWKLFDEPKLMIQSLKLPFSPLAQTAVRSNTTNVNQGDLAAAAATEHQSKQSEIQSKIAVHKATHPAKPKKDSYLSAAYSQMVQDIVNHVSIEQKVDTNWIGQIIRTELQPTVDRLVADQVMAFRDGYASVLLRPDDQIVQQISLARRHFVERAGHYVNRLANHVISSLGRRTRDIDESNEMLIEVRAVLESFRYRTDFISDVEIGRAKMYGTVIAYKDLGADKLYSVSVKSDSRCKDCAKWHKVEFDVNALTLEDVPPYHANCDCHLVTALQVRMTRDSVWEEDDDTTYVLSADDSTVEKQKRDIGRGSTYDKGPLKRVPSGQAKYQACTLRAKTKLKTMHPEWDDDKITEMAQTSCMHWLEQDRDGRGQDAADDQPTADDKKAVKVGRNLSTCVEQIKKQLSSKHPDWTGQQIAHEAMAKCTAAANGGDKGAGRD